MPSPISIFLLLMTIFHRHQMSTALSPSNSQQDAANPEQFQQVYTNPQGKLMVNGWIVNTSVPFRLMFKQLEAAPNSPNALYFDMNICPKKPGEKCDNGLTLCYVGHLDPDNEKDVLRTFELRNQEEHPITKECKARKESNLEWRSWANGRTLHGLHIRSEPDGGYSLQSSYAKSASNPVRVAADKCFILRFNSKDSIGGVWVVGGKEEKRSDDFRKRVHNGALLENQDPVFSLPLDLLTKFNQADELFGVIGHDPNCGISITFEGDNLHPCYGKKGNGCMAKLTEMNVVGGKQEPFDSPKKTGISEDEKEDQPATKVIDEPCISDWKYVIGAKYLDLYESAEKLNGKRISMTVSNFAVRVGFLKKPAETDGPYDFKALKESVNLASRKYPEEHQKSKFVMQKLEKSSLRDLKEETDYDYVDISVKEHTEEENADLGAEVLVHECAEMVFVSAVRAKEERNENALIWANYSKDLSFLDYCCYKWDSILIKKFGPAGQINNGEKNQSEHMDATIEHVKFGYELPGKNLTRWQQLAAKFKYGLSLAERPRLVNQRGRPYKRSCKFSSKCLFPIDGRFIGPPKLSVEQSEEHKVKIEFSDDDGTKWENGSKLVQVRQWAIRCDCSNAKEGTNGLMRQLKFSTPRIYAAVIDNEADQQRDTKIGDLVNTVTVDSRTKVTRDSSGRPFILYNEKEWKGN